MKGLSLPSCFLLKYKSETLKVRLHHFHLIEYHYLKTLFSILRNKCSLNYDFSLTNHLHNTNAQSLYIMGLWDYSRMESSSSIIYVSQIWAITLLIQIQLMEATSFSRNIMNADKVSHMERISPCTSHPRRGALVCMEITLNPARVSTCHSVHWSECKPCPDTNWKWKMLTKISAMWVMIYDCFA